MSWEQPCVDEARPYASSTKNAKDKSNSAAIHVLHDSKHTDNSNGRSCSEKDSGFSDTSSERKHRDTKYQCNEKPQRETKEESLLKHNEPVKDSNRRNVIVAPGTHQQPQCYIIKHMVQPSIMQKHAQLLWSSEARPAVSAANPIILLQPQFLKPPGLCNSDVTAKKTAAYLPLKSYPRIAPHPNKKPTNKITSDWDSFSKRVCIESNNTLATQKLVPSTSLPSSSSATVSAAQPTSSVSSITTTELNKHSIINTRHRRFLNTVQVLKQSGLWDITLRTKELMRQSNATRRDIAQLRQHSDLLCQVTRSSDQNLSNQKAAWLNLHKIMSESGSYPGLNDLQAFQVPPAQDMSVVKPQSVKLEDDSNGSAVVSGNGLTKPIPQQTINSREDEPNESLEEKGITPNSLNDD